MVNVKRFMGKLVVSPVGDNGRWKLEKPYYYLTDKLKTITVPAGFTTNFASIPRVFRSIIEPWGDHGPAAVIHDYLYSQRKIKRKEADLIFLEAMKNNGVSYIKRMVMYYAVRLGGWAYKD